ncbi:MAG: response regulator [Pseudomonadales bacterium]|nr:response regulator [Pseudomonadales bacterium]
MSTAERPDEQASLLSSRSSIIALLVTLVIGLGLTAALFLVFGGMDRERLRYQVERGAQTLSLYGDQPWLAEIVEQTYALLDSVSDPLGQGGDPVRVIADSDEWNNLPPTLTGTRLEYLPRIVSGEFDAFAYNPGLMENFNLPIMEQGPDGLQPAGARDEYFPVMYEASHDRPMATLGLDRAADPLFRAAMDQARDSGLVTSYSLFPLPGMGQEFIASHYYMALYDGGVVPESLAARREQHVGFVSAVTYAPAQEILPFFPDSILGIEAMFFSPSPTFTLDDLGPEISRALGRGDLHQLIYMLDDDLVGMIVRPTEALAESMRTAQRWWALGGGLSLTFLGCMMIQWSRMQSQKVVRLVHQRTHALAEQTRRLGETNAALVASEARYRMLADNASDVIYTYDLEGNYTYISPSVEQQTGFPVEDYIGKPVYTHLDRISARKVRLSIRTLHSRLQDKTASFQDYRTFEYSTWCKDGSTKQLETTESPLLDEEGQLTGFLGVARDVTQRKTAEEEKALLEEAYRHSQKMEAIGTLAGGVAHDFNNLLTALLGHTELLAIRLKGNPSAMQSINVVEKAALRARDLTSQLLGFARKGRFQAVPVNLNRIVAEVESFIERTVNKNVRIRQDLSIQAPVVIGDPLQMSQIFLNLAINACDAMPEGGELTFTTRIVSADEGLPEQNAEFKPGPYCVVEVADTGMGIASDKQERIFEPFYTDKPVGQGTGMGLAMVYGVTTSHGGVVTVDSAPGKGARFRVYLPAFSADDGHENDSEDKCEDWEGHAADLKDSGRKRTVLLVDDEEAVRTTAQQMLSLLGYRVYQAVDGKDAAWVFQAHQDEIDLAIIDMIMPDMGGLECLQTLRQLDPALMIILSSGYSKEEIEARLQEEHVAGFLQKPYRLQQLSDLMAQATVGL